MAVIRVTYPMNVTVDGDSSDTTAVNANAIRTKTQSALTTNATYLAQPAIPAGTLTTAQLGATLRILRDQLDAITKQNNAIIRLTLNQLDDVSDT